MPENKAVYGDVAVLPKEPDWVAMRSQMPIARRYAYLDHAAVGPLPEPAAQQMAQYASDAASHGDVLWPQWYRIGQLAKQIFATSMDTTPERLSLIPNTSTGISQIALGFPWKPGANVVAFDNEFPSNERPWSMIPWSVMGGVELRRVRWPFDGEPSGGDANSVAWRVDDQQVVDRLLDACDAQTQVITVSWVGYGNGFRFPIERLVSAAEKRGIAVFLDAIQGLGVDAFSLRECPVPFLAADGHKWMLGPEGIGILYVREDWAERIQPVLNGWHNAASAFEFRHGDSTAARDGRRFEPGTLNMAGIHGFAASLNFLRSNGWSHECRWLPDRIATLRGELLDGLRHLGAEVISWHDDQASGIVAFRLPGEAPADVRQRCLNHDVVLSARCGYVRAALHAYNNEQDVQRLLHALAAPNHNQPVAPTEPNP